MLSSAAQSHTVVEYPNCYVVICNVTGEETVVNKDEPLLLAALAQRDVRLQARA